VTGWDPIVEGKPKTKNLELVGLGYKGRMEGGKLILNVGFCKEIPFEPWAGTKIEVDKSGTKIAISGDDKSQVGGCAAAIRDIRCPEPYGGKGIRYEGEVVLMKAGKQSK